MSPKGAKRVDLARLAATLPDYPLAYLITVDDRYRAHTVAVEPALRGAVLDVGLVGGGTRDNLAGRPEVTMLWPPPEPGGYSLIVDGRAELTDPGTDAGPAAARCRIVPTRALLHRNAESPGAAGLHDCVVFSLPVTEPVA
jgi:hypothetical protein